MAPSTANTEGIRRMPEKSKPFGSSSPLIDDVGAALLSSWSDPRRRYHDIDHLRDILGYVDMLAGDADDADAGADDDGDEDLGDAGEDCTECDGRSGRVERITREITLQGPLSEEQRSDLLRVADLCPVHRTLEGQPVIVTRLNPER